MIKRQPIEKFLEEVASNAPTPGGGAVAAVTGATAAALVEMVVNLSTKYKVLSTKFEKAKTIRQELLKLADEDVTAFNAVMASYRTSKEDNSRGKKIQKALKGATDVPLRTAQLAKEVNILAKEILKVGNKNAASDAKTAIYLSEAAKKSALENVKINLKYIKNSDFISQTTKAVTALKK